MWYLKLWPATIGICRKHKYIFPQARIFGIFFGRDPLKTLLRPVTYLYLKAIDIVKCYNGVKQGGILSPILFTVYMDKLLQKLSKSKLGCHIDRNYMGSFGYADDIVLLAPTFFLHEQIS